MQYDQLKRLNRDNIRRRIIISEVNPAAGVVTGKDYIGNDIRISFNRFSNFVVVPEVGELWEASRRQNEWFLENKITDLRDAPDLQPGDTYLSTSNIFYLSALYYVGPFLPPGGDINQALVKKSDLDFDAEWKTIEIPEIPEIPVTHSVPPGGTAHQSLLKISDVDYHIDWFTIYEVPAGGTTGQVLTKTDNSDHQYEWTTIVFPDPPVFQRTLDAVMDGSGTPLTTGIKGDLVLDFDCEIKAWTVVADLSGDLVIDVWRSDFATFPPTLADSLTGGNEPELIASDKGRDDSLIGWTTSLNAGDILRFNIDSTSGVITRATLALELE